MYGNIEFQLRICMKFNNISNSAVENSNSVKRKSSIQTILSYFLFGENIFR